MVIMTYMSYIIRFLSLVKIIPGGKSTLVDRIALILWTVISIGVTTAFLIVNMENTKLLLSFKISVTTVFTLSAGVFLPCLNIVAILPALHHLVSAYPHVLKDTCLPSLQHSWLFSANIVLCFAAPIAAMWGLPFDILFYFTVNLIAASYLMILMIISSLIIGICTSQIKTKIEKNTQALLTKDSASKMLQEFQELKAGISPLLFLTFSAKCLTIIQIWSIILTYRPEVAYVLIAAYNMMDLFYLTTVLHQTYTTFKVMSLKLR